MILESIELSPKKLAVPTIRPFAVSVRINRLVNFVVDARTSEEAEDAVESYIDDGEEGVVAEQEIEFEDTYPIGE